MTAAELTRLRLLELAGLEALVSTRVYTLLIRDLPCVRVATISGDEAMHLRGSAGTHAARVQVDAIASVLEGGDALAIARNISEAAHGPGDGSGLDGFSGSVSGSPGITIDAILPLGDPTERYSPEEQEYITVSRDYAVHYRNH